MMMKCVKLFFLSVFILILGGCRVIKTDVSVREMNIPAKFDGSAADTVTIAKVNWRDYFRDPLLHELIDSTLSSSPDLKIVLQRIENARAQIKTARAAQLPTVNANINASARKFGFYTMDDAGNRVTEFAPGDTIPTHLPDFFIGLTTTWEADIWGKLKNLRKSAVTNYLASIEGKNFVVSNLIADITSSYYSLLALDHELDIIKETIKKQEQSLEVVLSMKESGRANSLAVQQFQAQLLQSQIMEKETVNKITETENRINLLVGRFPQPIKRNKDHLFDYMPDRFTAGVPSQLLTYRPDIREAELRLLATKFELHAAKASFLPGFNISAGLGYQAFNPRFLFITPQSMMYAALGSLMMPVINRKAIQAAFSNAKANQLSAMYYYQKTILNGYVEVANELSNIQRLKEINALKKQQNEVLDKSVETATDLFKTAKANYLEVLIAQQNSLQTKIEFVEVNQRQMSSAINIYKALGGGW